MPYAKVRPTIGSDPELFIYKIVDGKKQLIPADKVLPSKEHKSYTGAGYAFFDGVQAEINPQQSTCREIHNGHIHTCLNHIYNDARKVNDSKIILSPSPCIDVDLKELEGCDDECFRFGCAPSDCIYRMPNIKYPDGNKFTKRFAGGHIHIGFSDLSLMRRMNTPDKLENLIKMCDLFGGIIGTAICYDTPERIRRRYYGQAGTYRIQPHGIEYRTLSNFWLVSPEMTSLMTGIIRDAVRYTYGNMESYFIDRVDMEEVRKVINKVDNKRAAEIYKEVILPRYVRRVCITDSPLTNPNVRDVINHLINVGCNKVFNPDKLLNYWNIKPCNYKQTLYEKSNARGIHWFANGINEGRVKNYSSPSSLINYDIVYNQE